MESSLPFEFENRMKALLAEEWDAFLAGYLDDRYQALRFNPAKVSAPQEAEIYKTLSGDNTEPEKVPWAEHGYYYEEPMRPGRHPYHEMGLYYIQEPSAMSAASLLHPLPGMRILDLCAAPGGKTTQLAGFLQNKGLLVANEINSGRCRILSQNIERLGITNCIVTNEASNVLADHFPCYFHGILVDAPCSGEGMFRKNPQAIAEWSPENVRMCAERQAMILDNAAAMLLPGGRLVYSTCTFAPEENEQTISAFLQRHSDFHTMPAEFPWFSNGYVNWGENLSPEVVNTFRLWPHKLHGEGHFAALLVKDGELHFDAPSEFSAGDAEEHVNSSSSPEAADLTGRKKKDRKPGKNKADGTGLRGSEFNRKPDKKGKNPKGGAQDDTKILEEFLEDTLTEDAANRIRNCGKTTFGTQLYALPAESFSLSGLHVMRAGLQIGEFLKNRLVPSHALALALDDSKVRNCFHLPLTDPRSNAFFRGESIMLTEEETKTFSGRSGWILVAIDGYSAGWGKLSGSTIKNHYPKGLRFDFDT